MLGEDGDAVERAASEDPGAAPPALGRLHADQTVEGGRDPPRPGRIGAERETDKPRRHRDRRPGTGAADAGAVEYAARRAIKAAHTVKAGSELVEIDLPHRDRACRDQSLNTLTDADGVWAKAGQYAAHPPKADPRPINDP